VHDVAPPETERVIQALLPPGAVLMNNFGMTESAGCVTYTPPELPADVRAGAAEDELGAHCRGQVASFKVPRAVRCVRAWPMPATKVQKRVLKEWLEREPG
jgi:acyl-CoA synthetase (AMP-forming)/AMP-acid ligase II